MISMATIEKTITIKAPRELIEQLREVARLHNRSLSGELRQALQEYLAGQKSTK